MRLRILALCAIAFPGLTGAAMTPLAPGRAPARPRASATFARDIAPILLQNCAPCHRPGEVAPFSLLTYHDAEKRARQIAEITSRRIMPPWKADSHGEFLNERRLTAAQIETLRAWAGAGAKEGNPADLPPLPKFTDGWRLGKPDIVLKMSKPFTIPAEGRDVYRNFVIPVNLPEDKYIRAAEFRPGNRRVVHHATATFDKTGKARQLEEASGGLGAGYWKGFGFGADGFLPSGALPGYVPGESPAVMPDDVPGVLPKQIDVIFGMHYHPDGKIETDQSSIGLYLTDRKPKRTSSLVLLGVLNIDIAPGEAAHLEKAVYTLPVDVEVQGIGPHMHLLGKTCHLWAELPDGTKRDIIQIHDWDFNWQGTYRLKQPYALPKGTRLCGEWTHDNTANNPHNPNSPPKQVKNGENSTDEMAGAWFNVIVKNEWENGAIWLANLGHLAAASVTPPTHYAPPHVPGRKDTTRR